MINKEKLQAAVSSYKKYFPEHWKEEMFKWEAVKHFQKNWDINASDFKTMLEKSLAKTEHLLESGYFYARAMILSFAEEDPDATRAAFLNLFDESKNLQERVESFQAFGDDRRDNHNPDGWKNHYQNTNAISTYLWLKYPDKYYIYKYSEYLAVANVLESDFIPKRTSNPQYMIGGYKLYDEICEYIQNDDELKAMFKNLLEDSCYPDEKLKTLTIDIGFFISRIFTKQKSEAEVEWFPADYSPNLSVDDWVGLLNDKDVFQESSLEIMKRILDYGGQATCTQLSIKYGETKNFYNTGSSSLAQRIAKKTNCQVMERENQTSRWWPILYVGRNADKNDKGSFIWKLRDELKTALDKVDLSQVLLYAETSKGESEQGYWWLTASPKIWSFSNIAIGDVQSYTLYNDNGNRRRIFQNFLDAKAGDIVIGYEANPVKQVVAIAKISKENDGENIYFEKMESLSTPIDYQSLRECPELERMEFFVNPNGSMFKLTKGEFDFIMDVIREQNPVSKKNEIVPKYTKEDFLSKVYMSEEQYDALAALLKAKKNVILKGAPGVGKTFTARRLAYSMMGEQDDSRIEFVQFHQNYSYEDFVMGYKPDGDGFRLKNGIFYQFCQNASNHPDKDYFFIIDEINRGNMSKIFGELLMLIEKDYRGTKATLAYSGTSFSVPPNLYIIGMMNTADRSIAMIDYALRRRFSFFEMEPGFNSGGFKTYQKDCNNETFDILIDRVKELNKAIFIDSSLGKGFRIGHSYFCGRNANDCTISWMRSVVEYDIIPMLEEYWFDEPTKLQQWSNILRGVFDDE